MGEKSYAEMTDAELESARRQNRRAAAAAGAKAAAYGEMADRGEMGSNAPTYFDDRPQQAKRKRSPNWNQRPKEGD